MGSKTKLRSYCTKRGDDTVNLVTSRKTNARLARPIICFLLSSTDKVAVLYDFCLQVNKWERMKEMMIMVIAINNENCYCCFH